MKDKSTYKVKNALPLEKWIFSNCQPTRDDDHIFFVAMNNVAFLE